MGRRRKLWLAFGGLLLLVGAVLLFLFFAPLNQSSARITGKLTAEDAAEIHRLLVLQRAPLVHKEFSPENIRMIRLRIRERLAGELVSIASEDGGYARAEYKDRWNKDVAHDYHLHKLTNGWKIIGVGSRRKIR